MLTKYLTVNNLYRRKVNPINYSREFLTGNKQLILRLP